MRPPKPIAWRRRLKSVALRSLQRAAAETDRPKSVSFLAARELLRTWWETGVAGVGNPEGGAR